MMALIKKDLYLVSKQLWILLGVAAAFSILPQFRTFGSVYLPVLAMTLPLTAMAYDERCHWDKFLAMTPCRPVTAVLSKYLFALLVTAAALGAAALISFTRAALAGESYDRTENLLYMVTTLALVVSVNAVSMPAVFRFGAEKGRFIMMAACFAVLAVIIGGAQVIGADAMFGWMEQIPPRVLGAAVAVVVIAANAVSFFLSVRFYRKRQAGAYA